MLQCFVENEPRSWLFKVEIQLQLDFLLRKIKEATSLLELGKLKILRPGFSYAVSRHHCNLDSIKS